MKKQIILTALIAAVVGTAATAQSNPRVTTRTAEETTVKKSDAQNAGTNARPGTEQAGQNTEPGTKANKGKAKGKNKNKAKGKAKGHQKGNHQHAEGEHKGEHQHGEGQHKDHQKGDKMEKGNEAKPAPNSRSGGQSETVPARTSKKPTKSTSDTPVKAGGR